MSEIIVDIQQKSWPSTEGTEANCVIKELNFSLSSHEFVCMVGPSGCGKSTLLNLIANLDRDYQGSIRLNSNSQNNQPRIGYVFQSPRLLPWKTVRENIELAMPESLLRQNRGLIDTLLETTGLADAQNSFPEKLSLGMSRRVALVRAFAIKPDFLLMDEPFVSLDAPTARKVRALLIDLWKERPHTVLFVTHDLNEAILLADRILFLSSAPTHVVSNIKIEIPREERNESQINAFKKTLYEEEPLIRALL